MYQVPSKSSPFIGGCQAHWYSDSDIKLGKSDERFRTDKIYRFLW